jgi:hypothetical protein
MKLDKASADYIRRACAKREAWFKEAVERIANGLPLYPKEGWRECLRGGGE